MKKLTTQQFIEKAISVHGDKYDYSRVNYQGSEIPVEIICPIHGVFSISPHNFLSGQNCPACSKRQRIDTDVFIKRATHVHGGRYDYSLVECNNSETSVKIICPLHGEFFQKAKYHLKGHGCPKCFGTPKSSTEEFINKAKTIYGDKYDYSKVKYNGNKNKVIITCPIHGDWLVTPNNFLRGSECPKCYGTPKFTTREFIDKAKKVHGGRYDYSKVEYKGRKEKVIIICPEHGEFYQTAGSHLHGSGCPVCGVGYKVLKRNGDNIKIDKALFLKKTEETHTIKYDYSKISFDESQEKICIICPEHGEFWQSIGYHMRGGNCPKCAGSYKLTTKEFIEKAKKIHGDKYDYSKVDYINYNTKVCIICPEHGEFWQIPNNHLFGAGCPTCPESNMEGELRLLLEKNHIRYEQEKSFSWLAHKRKMFLDFYLPDIKIAIECQGGQHFYPVDLFGGEEYYNQTILRDRIKNELCKEHDIQILYFSKSGGNYIYPVISAYGELIKLIKNIYEKKARFEDEK